MMRPKDKTQLEFYWNATSPFYATSADTVNSGIGPYSWYGRLQNSPMTLIGRLWTRTRIRSQANRAIIGLPRLPARFRTSFIRMDP